MGIDGQIMQVCRDQLGLVTLPQLRELGVTERQLRLRVGDGRLERVHTGVFRIAASPETWHQRVLGASLAGGPSALAARRSAARLWGLAGAHSERVEIVVPRWSRRLIAGVTVIESTDLRDGDAGMVSGVPATSVPRTLIDCASRVGPDRLARMADDAVRRRLTTYEDVLDRFVRLARRGRPGVVRTRQLLEARLGVELGANDFERMVLDIVARFGLPEPVVQYPVILSGEKFLLDLAWPERRRFVECDGWDTHGSPQALDSDLRRQNLLVLAGWVPLRFAWRTVRDQPALVGRQIREALAELA